MSHKIRKVKKVVEEIVGTKCDMCGKDCGEEYICLNVSWGYESKKDGEKWTADICESCVDKVLSPHVKFRKERYF